MNEITREKIIRKLSILVFVMPILIILHFIFRRISPIQFTIEAINNYIYYTLVVCELLFVLIIIWMVKYVEKELWNIIIRVLITAPLVYIFPTIGFIFILINMNQRAGGVLYENKINDNLKIEAMSLDHGAWDSGGGAKIVKVNYFFPLLRLVSEIDTNKLDKREWIIVKYDPYRYLKKKQSLSK